MEIKDKIKYGLIFLVISGSFILCYSFIHNIKYTNDDSYKARLADKDSIISAIKETRVTDLLLLSALDKKDQEHKKNDSLTALQFQKGTILHNQLNDKANKISQHIASIANNDDSLRSELSDIND